VTFAYGHGDCKFNIFSDLSTDRSYEPGCSSRRVSQQKVWSWDFIADQAISRLIDKIYKKETSKT